MERPDGTAGMTVILPSARRAATEESSTNTTLQAFQFAMFSDVGRVRRDNEDFCAALPSCGVFVVCDGMGGAAAGEVASRVAAETFLARVKAGLTAGEAAESLLREAVEAANRAVRQQARMEPGRRGMGTTLVALLLEHTKDNPSCGLWLAHVGDSRCYRIRARALDPMTRDHSLVEEQIMAGQITEEQAERSPMRNVITRAVGSSPEVKPEIQRLSPAPGDVYLLASDGLTREVSEARLAELLAPAAQAGSDLRTICAGLVHEANAAGGRDNITVLLLRIGA